MKPLDPRLLRYSAAARGYLVVTVVLGYQGWTYWVFRKRLTRSDIAQPPVTGPEMEPVGGRP